MVEPEILAGRRAFPVAQELLGGIALRRVTRRIDVGWHGTEVDSETGAFAVVRKGADLDDLIGEVLKLTTGDDRSVFVYTLGARDVPTDISITRRSFFPGLGVLAHETETCVVEVIA